MHVLRLVMGFYSALGKSVCWMNKCETSSCTAGIFHFISNIESFIHFISRLILNESAPGHSAGAVRVLMGNRNTPQVPVCGDKLPSCETKWRWCSHSLLPLLQTAVVLLIILGFNSIWPLSFIVSDVIREAGGGACPGLKWTQWMRGLILLLWYFNSYVSFNGVQDLVEFLVKLLSDMLFNFNFGCLHYP